MIHGHKQHILFCGVIRLIIVFIIVFVYNYVCECTVGVDVGDGSTTDLTSILSNVVMGCIVLGRQMNVYFATVGCINTIPFVGMNVRFCTMKIHDSIIICNQSILFIVVHRTVVQSCFCISTTVHPITMLHTFTLCCCNSGTLLLFYL